MSNKISKLSAKNMGTNFPKSSRAVKDIEEAISIKYNNIVYELKAKGQDIITLSLGEAFFDIPLFSFGDLPSPAIFHYSHSRGLESLRAKIANYYDDLHHVSVDFRSEIVLSAGSKIAIFMALKSIIDVNDEVLIYEPAWVSYTEQVKLCGGKPISIPMWESINQFESYITSKTKALIINNPNNPRGSVLTSDEISYLHELARKAGIYIISDEAYSEFVEHDQFISFGEHDPEKDHTVICNSMSKNYGMSGWRLGYVISNKGLIEQILKLNQHLITCPSSILELYLDKHFQTVLNITRPQIKSLLDSRVIISNYIDTIGLSRLPGEATFYYFISIAPSKLDSEEFSMQLLLRKNVCVVPGIGYGQSCGQFVRVSFGSEPIDRVTEGLLSIKKLIEETSVQGVL
jgi:aminotransferase